MTSSSCCSSLSLSVKLPPRDGGQRGILSPHYRHSVHIYSYYVVVFLKVLADSSLSTNSYPKSIKVKDKLVHTSYSSAVNYCIIAVLSSVLGITNDVFCRSQSQGQEKSPPPHFQFFIGFGQQHLPLFITKNIYFAGSLNLMFSNLIEVSVFNGFIDKVKSSTFFSW